MLFLQYNCILPTSFKSAIDLHTPNELKHMVDFLKQNRGIESICESPTCFTSKRLDNPKTKKMKNGPPLSKAKCLILLFNAQQKMSELTLKNVDFGELLCFWDGIVLRSDNQEYIEWLVNAKDSKFNIIESKKKAVGDTVEYTGRYRNIEIKVHYAPKIGRVIDFFGSVHVWSNYINGDRKTKHNHNDFYWKDFLRVYAEMQEEFLFPEKLQVVSLEVGVSWYVPFWFAMTLTEIFDNTITMHGKCAESFRHHKGKEDRIWVPKRGSYLKAYDKGLQCRLGKQKMRQELGLNRSQKIQDVLGIFFFSDLLDYTKTILAGLVLIDCFEGMHIHSPEIINVPQFEKEANPNILRYHSRLFWKELKQEDEKMYKKERLNEKGLNSFYCTFKPHDELMKMLKDKVSW